MKGDDLEHEERRTQTFDSGAGASDQMVEPGARVGRYEILELLGTGGMGTVYRARDTLLERELALKILPRDEPRRLQRFLREARAQAAVDHDNVCRIYEAGEEGSVAFIAMQLIRGRTLEAAAKEMSFETKALVLAQVAEGVHAAHRQGLIHRDIKPRNIMVTRDEDGAWHAHVLDFGIAKVVEGPELTASGVITGTPAYMAPEQVNGEALDRRVDIFALGAATYAILAGRPPFTGSTSVDVMINILGAEPKPLSKVDRRTPRDLETIVNCCLEKDPNRRYPSARALAEDLRRFVDGEAIVARPPSVVYRFGKLLRRHRAVAAVAAVAVLGLAVLGGLWWHARWSAQRTAELAQEFGREVERIEGQMRLAQVVPIHDLRPEKQQIRRRMKHLEQLMRQGGRRALAPGSYALGRAYLALDEAAQARSHLERAWQAGQRTPATAYGLGLALGTLYQKELDELRQIRDEDERERRRRTLQSELRDPAVEYLRRSAGYADESPHYVAGLIALFEQRYDEAVAEAERALAEQPWLYEARRLMAEARTAKAIEMRDSGEIEQAEDLFQAAEEDYHEALEIGENDPAIHEGLCRLYAGMIEIKVWAEGQSVDDLVTRALPSCRAAVTIDPERVSAVEAHAYTGLLWAQALRDRVRDPEPGLEIAREAAAAGLELKPDDARLHRLLGTAAWLEAAWAVATGKDPSAALDTSVSRLERAVELDPSFMTAWVELGLAHQVLGRTALARGQDPSAAFASSVAAYEQAMPLNPEDYKAPHNLATTLLWWGYFQVMNGEDPTANLERAVASARRSLELNPDMLHARNNLSLASLVLGQYQSTHGVDPAPAYSEGVSVVSAILAQQPDYLIGLVNRALTRVVFAIDRQAQGQPADELLRGAETDASRVIELSPEDASSHLQLGRVWWLRARAAMAAGEDPGPAFDRALESIASAIRFNARDLEYQVIDVGCRLDRLHHAVRSTGSLRGRKAWVRELRDRLARIFEVDSENSEGRQLEGELETLIARLEPCESAAASAHFEAARAALEASCEAASSAANHASLAELCLWRVRCLRAGGNDASEALEAGLSAVATARVIDRRDLRAELLGLLLEQLSDTSDPGAAARVQEILALRPDLDHLLPGATS